LGLECHLSHESGRRVEQETPRRVSAVDDDQVL
jgi:hypothetical protein